MKRLLLLFAFLPVLLFSQSRKQRKALEAQRKADLQLVNNLKTHLQFFEKNYPLGSNTISKDDRLAVSYIADQFEAIGLKTKGANGYIRQFKINEGKQIAPGTFLKVNGTLLTVKKDYFPFSFSASKSVAGMPAMALKEKGVPWFVDIKDWLDDDTKLSDTNIVKIIQKEALRAAAKGATALFIYNSGNLPDNLRFNNRDITLPSPVPVVYITSGGYHKYFTDQSEILDVEMNVAFKESVKNANNVAGFIDNSAALNIVIATPYCLWQEEGESLNKSLKIDEAEMMSGTAILIELARMLSSSKARHNNYTFIAYTAEDTITLKNNWFNNNVINSSVNYIINLDKTGRYNQDNKLLIKSYGASDLIKNITPFTDKNIEISFDSGAFRGKDLAHLVKVPIVSFSAITTVTEAKATADYSKINYEGELNIIRFIYRLIEATDSKGKLIFLENSRL